MGARLIAYTPDPERTVAAAARLCYSEKGVGEIREDLGPDEIRRMIEMLFRVGHLSVFEHASFTFEVSVSRTTSHQLVRHRIASYSQRSQRYVREDGFDYITPPSVGRDPEARERYDRAMASLQEAYRQLVELGVPAEDARYVLPNAAATQLQVTMNARSLLNFFSLRCCNRAQWEIRRLANQMLQEVRRVAPTIFAEAGPSCVSEGICREGKFSCGRIERLSPRKPRFLLRPYPPEGGDRSGH